MNLTRIMNIDSNYLDQLTENLFSEQGGYFTIEEFNSTYNQNFSILHMNVRSFFKNIDSFSSLLHSLKFLPEVIVLSETWLTPLNQDTANIEGYNSCHLTRSNRDGGGISVFIKDTLRFSKLDSICFLSEDVEICAVEIELGSRILSLFGIYRPPAELILHLS